jgi:alpha-L-rhamnosidase
MKVLLDHNPLAPSNAAPADFGAAFRTRPAWITPSQPQPLPDVTAYRLQFDLPQAALIRVHVSADERYLFYVDGQVVGRGPERGSDRAWFYESYDLALTTGPHTLVALVWQLGEIAPRAQVGLAGGFLLEAEGEYCAHLSTKSAAWECKSVTGISFDMPVGAQRMAWFVEPIQTTVGADYPWGVERGAGEGWQPVSARREDAVFPFGLHAVHPLQPALLPAQMAAPRSAGRVRFVAATAWDDPQFIAVDATAALPAEVAGWQALLDEAQPLVIPAHTHR